MPVKYNLAIRKCKSSPFLAPRLKIFHPAGDRTPDLLSQRQTCYHLSQRDERIPNVNTLSIFKKLRALCLSRIFYLDVCILLSVAFAKLPFFNKRVVIFLLAFVGGPGIYKFWAIRLVQFKSPLLLLLLMHDY